MKTNSLSLSQLVPAEWNANQMDEAALGRLRRSIIRYGLVQNLVVRPLGDNYEVLSGNQRIQVLQDLGYEQARCVVVDLDDANARLLAQALNRIQGEDDLGLKAEMVREILKNLPQDEVIGILPETAESLNALASLGQSDMARYLQNWQAAQSAKLRHMQFQLTPAQLQVVERALSKLESQAKEARGGSPNLRGTALFLLCQRYLKEEAP